MHLRGGEEDQSHRYLERAKRRGQEEDSLRFDQNEVLRSSLAHPSQKLRLQFLKLPGGDNDKNHGAAIVRLPCILTDLAVSFRGSSETYDVLLLF